MERVYKLTGISNLGQVNSGSIKAQAILDDAVLYPNPYMVISQTGYTKHYYAGAERLATVIGGGGKFRAVSPNQIATAIGRSLIRDVALGVADSYLRDGIGKAMGTIGDKTTLVVAGTRIAINAYNIFVSFISKGYNNQAAYDLAKEALSIGIKLILDGGTIKGATAITSQVATTAVTIAPYVMATAGVALAGWSYYKAGEYLMNMFWTIDRALNSPQFWGFYYGYPNDKQNW